MSTDNLNYLQDFSSSWRDGLGFCGLLHSQNPNIINFEELLKDKGHDHLQTLRIAFDTAESHFGITRLFDPEDIDIVKPDDRSIMTYIASIYHTFSKINQGQKGAKRLINITWRIYRVDLLKIEYEAMSEQLCIWIVEKTKTMMKRQFSNQIEELKKGLKQINLYLLKEKPAKYKEKIEIEAMFLSIMENMRLLNQDPYIPRVRTQDIESLWTDLEREENSQKVSLKEELLRQEKLQLTAANFRKKAHLISLYIDKMSLVLDYPTYGTNLNQVEASLKKHEAISSDIWSRKTRLDSLTTIADYLENEDYHDKDNIIKLHRSVQNGWEKLINLAKLQRQKLQEHSKVSKMAADLDVLNGNLEMLQTTFVNEQSSITPIVEKIQKNNIMMTELHSAIKDIEKIATHASEACDNFDLQKEISETSVKLKRLELQAQTQKQDNEVNHMLEVVAIELEELHLWICEKLKLSDLQIEIWNQKTIDRLKENQKSFENELRKWILKYEKIKDLLSTFDGRKADTLSGKISKIDTDFCQLNKVCERRRAEIMLLSELTNYEVELSMLEPWLKGLQMTLKSDECGVDTQTCKALCKRLEECGKQLGELEIDLSKCSQNILEFIENANREPYGNQKSKVEEKRVPQIQALYAFSANDICMKKGEVLFLIAKNNSDWWSARKADGQMGFVPRNYVKEIEPKVILIQSFDSQKSWFRDALEQTNIELRVKVLGEGLKCLKDRHKERALNLNNNLKLFEFDYECIKAIDWLMTRARVMKKEKISPTLSSSINNYENKIHELEGKYKFLRGIFDKNVDYLDRTWLNIEESWNNLSKACEEAEKLQNTKSEVFLQSQEYDYMTPWVLDKTKEFQNLTKFVKRDENTYQKLVKFGRELKLLQDTVSNFSHNLQTSGVPENNLNSQLTVLIARNRDEIERTKKKIESDEVDRLVRSVQHWVELGTKRIKMAIENKERDKGRRHMILREVRDELKDSKSILSVITNKSINEKDEEKCTVVLQETDNLVFLLERLDHALVVEDMSGRLNDEHRVIIAALRKLESVLSHEPDVEGNASDMDLRMNTLEQKISKLTVASETFLKKYKLSIQDTEPNELAPKMNELKDLWRQVKDMHEGFQSKATVKRSLNEFEMATDEIIAFTKHKSRLVRDLSYKGQENLKHKLKTHEVLQNEVRVYASHIKLHNLVGSKLIERHPILESIVLKLLEVTNSCWDELLDQSTRKAKFLRDSIQNCNLQAQLKRLDREICELENNIIKNWEEPLDRYACQKKITNLKVNLKKLSSLEMSLSQCHNLSSEKIENLKMKIDGLTEKIEDKIVHFHRCNLYITYVHQLEFENQWLEEKKIMLNNCINGVGEVGFDTRGKRILDEIGGHMPVISELLEDRKKWKGLLTESVKVVVDLIESNIKIVLSSHRELENKRNQMKEYINIHSELINLECWCEEKKSYLMSKCLNLNEAHAVSSLKSLKMMEQELDCHIAISREVQDQVESLSQSLPYKEEMILRSNHLGGELVDIQKRTDEKRSNIMLILQYLELEREVNATDLWIISKTKCLKHLLDISNNAKTLDVTFQSYTRFKSTIFHGESRVKLCRDLAERLATKDYDPQYEISNSSIMELAEKTSIQWTRFQAYMEESETFLYTLVNSGKIKQELTEAMDALNNGIEYLQSERAKSKEKTIVASMLRQRDFELGLAGREKQISKIDTEILKMGPSLKSDVRDLHHGVKLKWLELSDMYKLFREELSSLKEFLDFSQLCEEVTDWISQIATKFPDIEINNTSIHQTHNLRNDLESQRSQIEMREAYFKEVLEKCSKMELSGNPNAAEASKKVETLMEARQNLHMSWQQKKVFLDQIIDWNFFQRDVRKINNYLSDVERKLCNFHPLEDITNIISDIRNITVIENQVKIHSEKLHHLHNQAKKLIKQNHINSGQISTSMTKTNEYLKYVRQQVEARGKQLLLHQSCAAFHSSIDERIDWIEQKIISYEQARPSDDEKECKLSEKEDKLKKCLSFGADITHNTKEIEDLSTRGKYLLSSGVPDEGSVQIKLDNLEKAWQKLKKVTCAIEDELCFISEMQDIEKQLTKIETVLRDSEFLLSARSTGSDLEHCCDIQSNLGIQHKEHLTNIYVLNDIEKKVRTKQILPYMLTRIIRNRDMAQRLQYELSLYESELKKAELLHTMCYGIYENSDSLKERIAYLNSIQGIGEGDILCNKSDISSKFSQIYKHMENVGEAIGIYSEELSNIPKSNLKDITENKLRSLLNIHTEGLYLCQHKLEEIARYQNMVSIYKSLYNNKTMLGKMITNIQKLYVSKQESDIQHGLVIISDTSGQLKSYDTESLIQLASQYPQSKSINDLAAEVQKLDCDLRNVCTDCKRHLLAQSKIHFHQRQILDVTSWIQEVETKVLNIHGSSTSETQPLQKEIAGHLVDLDAKLEFVKVMNMEAEKTATEDKGNDMSNCSIQLESALLKLKESMESKVIMLSNVENYHELLHKINKLQIKIDETWQTAIDDNFSDLSNLLMKKKQHEEFTLLVISQFQQVINDIHNEATALSNDFTNEQNIDKGLRHEIQKECVNLINQWKLLNDQLTIKRKRLEEANFGAQFLNKSDDIEQLLIDTEIIMAKALPNEIHQTKAELKHCNQINGKINESKAVLGSLEDLLKTVNENFMHRYLSLVHQRVNKKMKYVQSLMAKFVRSMNDNLSYLEFNQNVQVGLFWMMEKTQQVSIKNTNLGGLAAVESMLRRHKILEVEVGYHSDECRELVNFGKAMIIDGNIKSNEIESEIKHICKLGIELEEKMAERKKMLDYALAYEHFQLDCNQLLDWIQEKEVILGKNGTTDSNIFAIRKAKIETLLKEISKQQGQISLIEKQREFLIALVHVREEDIEGMYKTLVEAFNRLSVNAKETESNMAEYSKYLDFLQDCDYMQQKIKNQLTVAASEDYGKDLIHIDDVLERFEDSLIDNKRIAEEFSEFKEQTEELFQMKLYGSRIRDQLKALEGLWNDTEELTLARKEALFGAKVIYTFDKSAAEVGKIIGEKDGILEHMITCVGEDLDVFSDMLDTIKIGQLENKVRPKFPDRAKKNLAKFGEGCPIMADRLCIGCPRLMDWRKAENSNMQEFFSPHFTVQNLSPS